MKIKNIAIIFFTLLLSVCTVFLVGCSANAGNSSTDKQDQPSNNSLSLDVSSLELLVGESGKIRANYEDNGQSQLEFSCDNESVIDVSDIGVITAKNVGTANVVATYGNTTAECVVNVTLGALIPEIAVNVEDFSLSLFVGDGFELDSSIRFNNKQFSFTPSIKIADESVAVMENGIIKATACGQTTVTVSGTWQGYNLEREMLLSVINPVTILFYDEASNIQVNAIELYTIDDIDGVNYVNVFNYDVVIKEGGELKTNYTVTTTSDIISIDSSNNSIKGEKSGSGFVNVGYEDAFGKSYEKQIEVKVIRPIAKSNKTLILSAYDGVIFNQLEDGSMQSVSVEEYFGEDFAVCDCDGATIEDGCLKGIDASAGLTNASIVLYGEKYGYIVDVKAYTLILDAKEDFRYFTLDSENVTFGGHYILANNINADGYTHENIYLAGNGAHQYSDFIGLTGTFDGRGYTVSNITIGGTTVINATSYAGSGLFGIVNKTGTVKNVAFNNVKFPQNMTSCSTIACYVIDGTIENVFIHGKEFGKWGSCLFAYKATTKSTIKNCIFYYDYYNLNTYTKNPTWVYGSFTGLSDFKTTDSSSETYLVDSYVISKTPMTHDNKSTLCDAQGWQYDSIYDGLTKYVYPNVKHYATYDEMKAASNDYSSFDTRFWKLTDGIPQWKNI